MSLLEKVQAVVAEKLSVDESEVVPEASFTDDLNADSLDLVELIMAFEEEFSSDDVEIHVGHPVFSFFYFILKVYSRK